MRLPELTLESLGLREREDLERWLIAHPELLGPDLLLITSEFDQWELREHRVLDRLDLLFLDSAGSLVVAELKRDRAADTIDLQALKYAAYCSQLGVDEVVDEFARQHGQTRDEAETAVYAHAPILTEGEFGPIRVLLVAGSFGPAVTTVVLWLNERNVDIRCVEITVRGAGNGAAIVSARQLLPLPQTEDYLVRRRRKDEQVESVRRASGRGATSISVLAAAGVLKEGDVVRLGLETLVSSWRPPIEAFLAANPAAGEAEWTGDVTSRSLKWRYDGEIYSATGLTKRLLSHVGIEVREIPGPDYWLLADGRPMYRASVEIRREREGGSAQPDR